MDYRVKKLIDLRPVLNIYWFPNILIDDVMLDKYFSVSTKEYFILNGFIEPLKHVDGVEYLTAEQFIETYHPERWSYGFGFGDKTQKAVRCLEKSHVLELLKRFAKIVRKEERERILETIKQAEGGNK